MALLHIIGDHYDIKNPGVLSWFIAGYSLTVGTFILFSGRLGDVFGWKRMLVFGYVWFAIWSVISGLAWYSNHVLFIFSRVLAGIGPAICMPNGLAMLGALYQPGKRKNMAFAVFGGCAPAGGIGGFLIAGLFNLVWWPCELSRAHKRRCADLRRDLLVYWVNAVWYSRSLATCCMFSRFCMP